MYHTTQYTTTIWQYGMGYWDMISTNNFVEMSI